MSRVSFLLLMFVWIGVQNVAHGQQAPRFEDDVALLGDGVVLADESGKRRVLVSPRFQGTVLVSTLDGESLGWINRKAVESGKGGIGGADRFWFGPDGSQYTVFFEPGVPLEEKNWRVPPEVEQGAMKIVKQSPAEVVMQRNITLKNHLGTEFKTQLKRTVRLAPPAKTEAGLLSLTYRVENEVTNLGAPWDHRKGLIAIWSLGSFTGGKNVEVRLPVPKDAQVRQYFPPFQQDQFKVKEGVVSFRCDGNWRSKIGLAPKDSSGLMLSLDKDRRLLTVIRYAVTEGERFPHAERGPQDRPYDGDLANVYNHGTLDRTSLKTSQFYEMESSSPMVELKTGEHTTHWQEVTHYRGDLARLEKLAQQLLLHE